MRAESPVGTGSAGSVTSGAGSVTSGCADSTLPAFATIARVILPSATVQASPRVLASAASSSAVFSVAPSRLPRPTVSGSAELTALPAR